MQKHLFSIIYSQIYWKRMFIPRLIDGRVNIRLDWSDLCKTFSTNTIWKTRWAAIRSCSQILSCSAYFYIHCTYGTNLERKTFWTPIGSCSQVFICGAYFYIGCTDRENWTGIVNGINNGINNYRLSNRDSIGIL